MVSKMSLEDERMSGNHSSDSSSFGSPLWSSQSLSLRATVPFSWEDEPGVPKHKGSSRVTPSKLAISVASDNCQELRPPPLLSGSCEAVGNYQLCRPRHKSKKAAEVEVEVETQQRDDPFMVAMVECTKQKYDHKISLKDAKGSNNKNKNIMWFYSLFSTFSCTGLSSKPKKLTGLYRTFSDLDRRVAKGKMSSDQVFDVP